MQDVTASPLGLESVTYSLEIGVGGSLESGPSAPPPGSTSASTATRTPPSACRTFLRSACPCAVREPDRHQSRRPVESGSMDGAAEEETQTARPDRSARPRALRAPALARQPSLCLRRFLAHLISALPELGPICAVRITDESSQVLLATHPRRSVSGWESCLVGFDLYAGRSRDTFQAANNRPADREGPGFSAIPTSK